MTKNPFNTIKATNFKYQPEKIKILKISFKNEI